MELAVAQLAPGERVVNALTDARSRISPLAHMVDRVCMGRCLSYSNYEPSTAGFRVRADGENAIVVSSFADSLRMQMGGYVVKPRDLPLYNLDLCAPGEPRICLTGLGAGDVLHTTDVHSAPTLGGG
jgi:hypothetical protein